MLKKVWSELFGNNDVGGIKHDDNDYDDERRQHVTGFMGKVPLF